MIQAADVIFESSTEITVIVPGKPNARKAHKIGAFRNPATGQIIRKPLLNDEDSAFQNLVKMAAQKAMDGRPPLVGHVWAHYLFIFPAPTSAIKKADRQRIEGGELLLWDTRADICNLLKNTNDGLKGIAVADDRLIRTGGFDIRIGLIPQTIIRIQHITQ